MATKRTVWSALETLGEAALAGDADAAKALAEEVTRACQWFSIIERKRPDLFASVARGQLQWPVLADDETGWEKEAVLHISRLQLGADFRFLKVRLRKARGTDANLPARRWAKAAVRVVEEARWRPLVVGQLIHEFGSTGALANFCMKAGWKTGERRAWCKEAAVLTEFSQASLAPWKTVIRQMIREDMPDFHRRPEWENQRRTASASGRDSVGEIQNAILDDIVSALVRLVPESRC